jgi:hypothetical protein
MLKLRKLFNDWGVPVCILSLWAVATIYTVHSLVGMKKATMQYQTRPARHERNS